MHEITFAKSIIMNINKLNPANRKIKKVILEVGVLAGIDANHLREHLLEVLEIDGKSYDIKTIEMPSLVDCGCGYNGKPEIRQKLHDLVIFNCPNCKSIPEVIEGKDIKILDIIFS
jgi:Zn finger protein HypA/HybF involved in hydrogenase expression